MFLNASRPPTSIILKGQKKADGTSGAPAASQSSTSPAGILIWVGNIAESTDDKTMSSLFEQCGSVLAWNRVEDPTTTKPKSFGFVKFLDLQGALNSLKFLQGLEVDGKKLILKTDKKLEKEVEESMQAQQNEFSDERSSDSVKRVIIQKILKDREKRRKENPELDWDKLSNMAKGLIRLEQEEAANPDTVYKGIVSQVRDYLTRQKKMDEQRRKSRHRANSNDYRERGRRISNHEEKSTKKRDNREDSFREADSKRQKQAEIPGLNDKKQLFSMDVNPNLIRNERFLQSNVKAWLQKATIEYMGEQDKDFVDFVLLQLREKCSAHHLIKELSMLEDDAEEFVAKLWRFLLLESNSFSSS